VEYFQYNLTDIPDPFIQHEGTIYWLELCTEVTSPANTQWGWKSSEDHWNDDAVWRYTADWLDLFEPPYFEQSLDLAFVITGEAVPTKLKWDQPPKLHQPEDFYYGWNEESTWWDLGPTVADDWVCTTDDPVTDIHWWGSFIGWLDSEPPTGAMPSHFHILFWTDVPAGVDDEFSHPGQVIHEIFCYDYDIQFVGWDFDPRGNVYEACFQFLQILDEEDWFRQDEYTDNIFWISISACYDSMPPPAYPWGWKTRPRNEDSLAPDDAVVITDPPMPASGSSWGAGYPIYWPDENHSWDMAFELTTYKWRQPPDLASTGMDVSAYYDDSGTGNSYVLADDFECMVTAPITDIHVWASWYGDYLPFGTELSGDPSAVSFTLSIHADIPPADNPYGPYSMPGDILWMRDFEPGEFKVVIEAQDLQEGWLEPPDSYDPNGDTVCFRYDFFIDRDEAFLQEGSPDQPVIYWLDVQAHSQDPNAYFGWKTSLQQWNDDAVWAEGFDPPPGDPPEWWDLHYPEGHPWVGQSLDLAFMITTNKWSQPPEPFEAFYGWDEWSVRGTDPPSAFEQIAADDWVCDTDFPVTDIHWWGSFIGYCGVHPDVMQLLPNAFHIGIWTDRDGGCIDPLYGPFSCPHELIHEIYCDDYNWKFVGWDWDPRDPMEPPGPDPESCFKFSQVLDMDNEEWFFQEDGENIYWISIAAEYPAGAVVDYPWGWKTLPRDPESPAPDDAIRIFNPTAPNLGDQFFAGEPIWWPNPTPDNSWDLAFQLTTVDCLCLGDMNMDGVVNGLDIQCFVDCLLNGFSAQSSDCNCACADMNEDGYLTTDDIPDFVTELLNTTVCPPGGPRIGGYSDSGCLPGTRGERSMCDEDEFEFTVEGNTLYVLHKNAEYNCCRDDIVVTLTMEGNVIGLEEEEILTEPCWCICCYDVESTVEALASGMYTVNYCWFDYGVDEVRCHEEEIVIP